MLENGEPRELAQLRARRAAARRLSGARHERRGDARLPHAGVSTPCGASSRACRKARSARCGRPATARASSERSTATARPSTRRSARASRSRARNTLMDTLVEAAIALASESGKRRALVVLSGSGAGHTNRSPADVSKEARRAGAPVFALMYDEGEGAERRLAAPRRHPARRRQPHDRRRRPITSGSCPGSRRAPAGASSACRPCSASAPRSAPMAAELGGQYRIRYLPGEGQGPRRVEVRVARPGVHWRVTVDSP